MSFSDQMEFEFEELKRKIQSLKQIEMKLNALNMEGFEYDVAKIESKLKKPTSVDEVEREFDLLERKIFEKKEEERSRKEKERIAEEERCREEERKQRELENLRKEALEQINAAKLLLGKAKKLGIHLQKEEGLLTTIQNSFDAKKYADAKIAAQQFQNEIERLLGDYKDSLEEINLAKLSLEKIKKFGIPNFEKEEHMLADAQNYFDEKEYSDAKIAAQHFIDTANNLIEKSKPNMLLNLPQKMQYNIWKFHDIIIKNNGTAHAKNIILNFSKVFEIRELKNISQIDAGKQGTLHINIKPTESGDVPVDYTIKFSDLQDRTYEIKNSTTIQIGTMPDVNEYSLKSSKNETPSDSLSGVVDVKTAFGYKGATIIYKLKIENNTIDPISDIKVYPDVPYVFLLKEKEKLVSLIEPKSSQTVTFEIRPTGECGDCNVSGRVNYYNTTLRKRRDIELEPKSLSIVCPMLHRKEISEDAWSELV
jgi:hypothetical protein